MMAGSKPTVTRNRDRQSSTKSKYFQHNNDDNDSDVSSELESIGQSASEFEQEDANGDDDDDDDEEEEEEEDEYGEDEEDEEYEDQKVHVKRKPSWTNKSPQGSKKSKTRDSNNQDDDEVFDGREIFIPKRKARDLDGIEYSAPTIHPNTLHFLRDLKLNNDRDWFWDHEDEYRAAKQDFEQLVEIISEKLYAIDPEIPPLPLKDVVYRIYRDVRFSNDKTLYKPYLAAAWSRTGRAGQYGHYFLHLEPGHITVAGGMRHISQTNPDGLQAMRRLFDRDPERFKQVLITDDMRKQVFVGLHEDDNNKSDTSSVVDEFVAMNQEDALKKNPKGYGKDHDEIALLRLKSYTVRRTVPDHEFAVGKQPAGKIAAMFAAMVPFVHLLNDVAMDNVGNL
ncbi:hypothetical protein V1514DRAFT_125059 [Lipomyces japonicus]|uniref:uncharacterized protein n=1 Tax=Lipomyces japonicus TaxID=56871 RepID=UPI0034CE9A6B